MNYIRSLFAAKPSQSATINRIYTQVRYASELDPLLSYTSLKNVPLILNVSAPWCSTCAEKSPIIESLFKDQQIGERLDYVELKADESELSPYLMRFGIKTFPTLVGIRREFMEGSLQIRRDTTRQEILEFLQSVAKVGARDRGE
jgi:thiol:disulfide interchange protein